MARAVAAAVLRSTAEKAKSKGKALKNRSSTRHTLGFVLMLIAACFLHFPNHSSFVVYSEFRTFATILGAGLIGFVNVKEYRNARKMNLSKSDAPYVLANTGAAAAGALIACMGGIMGLRQAGLSNNVRSMWAFFYASIAWVIAGVCGTMILDDVTKAELRRCRSGANCLVIIGSMLYGIGTAMHCIAKGNGDKVKLGSIMQVVGLLLLIGSSVLTAKFAAEVNLESRSKSSAPQTKSKGSAWFSFGQKDTSSNKSSEKYSDESEEETDESDVEAPNSDEDSGSDMSSDDESDYGARRRYRR
mmetsp:Transcript_3203/g.9772  ORF Transcript_3203/g.9772 Transcript_3203/m.9772 type:complete len:302 (-) Transcript_3203:419-1324(-)